MGEVAKNIDFDADPEEELAAAQEPSGAAVNPEVAGLDDNWDGSGNPSLIDLNDEGLSLPLTGPTSDPEPEKISAADLAALAEVEAELDTRWGETQIEPSLDRIERLMDILGHPERTYPVIHIAGTNGKTSTVRMIESIVRALGRRTGRYTSPHLQLVTERIAIDGSPIHPRDYIRVWQEIQPFVEMVDAESVAEGGPRMSKFEVLTAMAYAAFADAPVEVAIVETGMGGTWDATNVANADVAVVMPVGQDHTEYLGETIEEIAAEKAGIIKSRWDRGDLLAPPDNVAIIAEQTPEAMKVLLNRATEVDAMVARAGIEYGVEEHTIAVGGQSMSLRGLADSYTDIFVPLHGPHQARNAATALAAVEAFFGAGPGRALNIDSVRDGFAQVNSPGRLERVRATPSVFVDAAHNPHGAKALKEALGAAFDFRRVVAVVATLGEKDSRGILVELEEFADQVVVTQNASPRATDFRDLEDIAIEVFGPERVHAIDHLPSAVELAIALAEETDSGDGIVSGSGVIITGSVVTAGEARTLFGKEPQ
ncbi:bifunctional folylpolyglutamate synthase/dihydrofolate synthase [Corynebacterium sp. TAE3-ERU12]|nr:bifunctional folylpolyglutamate synthase/dihydrofolate synthase [Corynebacterium sp. TAE3-ERU12]